MARFLNFPLLVITAFIWITSCKKEEKANVKIAIKAAQKGSIEAVSYNLVDQDTVLLCRTKPDSSGNAVMEFDLNKPAFVYIVAQGQFIPTYLSPGNHLEVVIDITKGDQNVIFTGDGAEINQYLRRSGKIKEKYEKMDDNYSSQLPPESFLIRRNALKKDYAILLENLKSDGRIEKETIKLMEIRNQMDLCLFQQTYLKSRYGNDISDPSIPQSIKTIIDSLPLNLVNLKTYTLDDGFMLSTYLKSQIYEPLKQKYKTERLDSLNRVMPLLAEKEINNGTYPQVVKDFLLINHANFWLMMYGLSPELETVHQNLIKKVKDTDDLRTVNKNFDRWLKLGPGKAAPDFTGVTKDGKKISLSDLKGKIVYMDVWATWCGPCRQEFPYSKALIEEFKNNDKVAFLFVSIDENIPAWEKLLTDQNTPKGIQVNIVLSKQSDIFRNNYFIYGIPRYILINTDGKIVQALSDRPSSGKVANKLQELLNNDILQ